jgi:CTP:molybdopterin cytidylyltransferase MocA
LALTVVVLAAGLGRRFGGVKQLAEVFPDGRTVIARSMEHAARAGFERAVVIVRSDIAGLLADDVRVHWPADIAVEYVEQDRDPASIAAEREHGRTKPLGTAHAVLAAADRLDGPFAVFNADDLYRANPVAAIAGQLRDGDGHAVMGFDVARTLLTDRPVTRGLCRTDAAGRLSAIEEGTVGRGEDGRLTWAAPGGAPVTLAGTEPVSMNLWAFAPSILGRLAIAVDEFMASGRVASGDEVLLPSVVGRMVADEPVRVLRTGESCLGVTYREDIPLLVEALASER